MRKESQTNENEPEAEDLNQTLIQTEGVSGLVARETYMQHTAGGVLTPELLHPSATSKQNDMFYRSPQNREQRVAAVNLLQDQHQAYFTSDSNEKLATTAQAVLAPRSKQSLGNQASPRASYYSPQRNQSVSKNLWLNDTVPVSSASPKERQTLTPHKT